MIWRIALSVLLLASVGRPQTVVPEYQFGGEFNDLISDPMFHGRTSAFLWVPPHAKRLRAVMLAPANIIERRICDDASLRREADNDSVAIIFFQASWARGAAQSSALPAYMQAMLNALAERSGYEELKTIPWITVGHSGNTLFGNSLDRLVPDRIVASVAIKGGIPSPQTDSSASGAETVPILFIGGQFEEVMPPGKVRDAWWGVSLERFAALRAQAPQAPLSGIEDRGHGHIDWLPPMQQYLNLFLHKAIAARLSGDTGKLKPIAYETGWLGDPAGHIALSPATQYQGERRQAFWFFDREEAREWERLQHLDEGKHEQLLAFTQNGQIAPWWPGWGLQDLKFMPDPDGITFHVNATFRDAVPEPFADAGEPVGHVAHPQIRFRVAGWAGNVEQVDDATFRIAFDREGFNGRTAHVLIGALQSGDEQYRETSAIAGFFVPISNSEGEDQTIDFQRLPDLSTRNLKPIRLKATSSSGLPVRFFVSWGPAIVEGDTLRFTELPTRAAQPIEVRITAYQWGRGNEPRVKTAQPVTQTFHIGTAR